MANNAENLNVFIEGLQERVFIQVTGILEKLVLYVHFTRNVTY